MARNKYRESAEILESVGNLFDVDGRDPPVSVLFMAREALNDDSDSAFVERLLDDGWQQEKIDCLLRDAARVDIKFKKPDGYREDDELHPKFKMTQRQLVETHCELDKGKRGTLTYEEWLAIKRAWDKRCAYCGVKVTRPHIEHVTPRSRGGRTEPDNIVPSCGYCNFSKHTKSVLAFLGERDAKAFAKKHDSAIRTAVYLLGGPLN